MTREEFEAALKQDGFDEIVEGRMAPEKLRETHQHAWETRGLVLEGAFHLGSEDGTRIYRAGDIFTMAAGCDHSEATGPEGAAFVVGRKPVSPRPAGPA
jgi:quercetin dioxygenase-like cupin family protein